MMISNIRIDVLRVCFVFLIFILTPLLVAWLIPEGTAQAQLDGGACAVQQTGDDTPTAEGEAEDEDALIEAALLEQGYYSDDIPLDYHLQDVLRTSCEEYGVPYELALGVIQVESNFLPDAIGPDGRDYGLFQVRDSNHKWLQAETGCDPTEPAGNIRCGVYFMGHLYGIYNDWGAALTAYRYGKDNGSRTYYDAVVSAAERWSTSK